MIVSKILTDNFVYYDLHCEEVITSNFINDDNSGIYCDSFQVITFDEIAKDIENKKDKVKNIILDFKYIITSVNPNLTQKFTTLKNKGYHIALINIAESVVNQMSLNTLVNKDNLKFDKEIKDDFTGELSNKVYFKKFYLFEHKNNFVDNDFNIQPFYKIYFKDTLIPYMEVHNKEHTSSFVYLRSFVNIKKVISYEKTLMIYSIYLLAIKIQKEWKGEINEDTILVCQSLNSSYVVSILSVLLRLDILILDKIGPVNKQYNRLNNNISNQKKYIVVSDLVCLGTEVKIVKNLIEFMGGRYLGNVAIIKTQTLKSSDIKRKEATLAVFSIDKTNNKELNYYITTELDLPNE